MIIDQFLFLLFHCKTAVLSNMQYLQPPGSSLQFPRPNGLPGATFSFCKPLKQKLFQPHPTLSNLRYLASFSILSSLQYPNLSHIQYLVQFAAPDFCPVYGAFNFRIFPDISGYNLYLVTYFPHI